MELTCAYQTMKFQCAVYFIIIYTIAHSDATDVQTIHIPINNPDEEYSVQLKKPLKIVFEGANITRCLSPPYENSVASKKLIADSDPNPGSSWLLTPPVTRNMSTQWECVKEEKESFFFNIRVKRAYEVEVDLVGTIISFNVTNQTMKEYDGIYNYACEVGDTIDITCRNLYGDGHIILQYHDAQGANITYGQLYRKENSSLTFRMLVRGENVSRSYVDCTYVTPIKTIEQEFTYRTMFQITNSNPRRSDVVRTAQTLTTLFESVNLDHVTYQCYSNKNKNYSLLSEITFIRESNRDTYILGLSASNILYEYNTDEWNWTTHYQFTVNQILNLTCITAMDRTPQWANRKEIISTIRENTQYRTKYINYMFPMNIETIKTITCESKKKMTKTHIVNIILHQVLDIPAEKERLNSCDDNNVSENFTGFTVYEIIGTIAGILFATIGAVCALYLWKKKRNILSKLHTCLKKDDNQLHSLTNEVVNEYMYIENEYNYIQNQEVYMITNTAYCGSFDDYVTQKTTSQIPPPPHKENYYTEIVYKTTHNEINTTYAVPYEAHHMNKDKVNRGKDYENVINKSNTGYSNLQITDCNVSYSNFTNEDLNAS